MEFVIGLVIGGAVVFAVCFLIFAHWVDKFIRNFWN